MIESLINSTVPLYFLLPMTALSGAYTVRLSILGGRAAAAEQAELDARPLPTLSA